MFGPVRKTIYTGLLAGTVLGTSVVAANAGGFAVREQSTEGQGASYAGIAAGGSDLSSMFFNPATVTLHNGWQTEKNAALIIPYSKATNGVGPGGPNSGNIGKLAFVPASYASYQFNENLFLGFTVNSPFGLVTKGNATWAGSPHGIKSDLFMAQAGPVVGYKVNDMFSVAAAVRGVYSRVILTQNAGLAGLGKLKGNDWGVNYAVGLLISPSESTRIGIGYNSSTSLKYTGNLTFSLFPAGNQPVSAKLKTPGTFNVGLRQDIGEKFTVLLGFEWANWSNLKQLAPINRVTGLPAVPPTPFNWKDSYYYSIGGEYKWSDHTTLRAGFAYEDSPVPASTRGVRVPDADRFWLSVGGSTQLTDNLRASVAYTHIIAKNGNVNLVAPTPLTATFKQHVNIIAVSGTYTFN